MKILSQAPSRISLFGGGTDVDPYASTYGGICINLAINLRSHFTLFTDDDIYDPQANSNIPYLGTKEFIYTFLKEFNLGDMHLARFNSQYDGLLQSGLGSSASSAVAILGALNKFKNLKMSLSQIAEKAWEIEVHKLGLYGGKQDQYAAAFGGVNVIFFDKEVRSHSFPIDFIKPLIPSLVLFYTGENRKSIKIQEGFKDLTISQVEALNKIKKIAEKAVDSLKIGDVESVGKLLDQTWQFKKESNQGVTSEVIDKIYTRGRANGAIGGKVMGAGGGGYFIFIVYPEKREKFIENMQAEGFEWWDFSIDWNGLEVRDITGK